MKSLNIIGCGKLGKVIGKLLSNYFTINCVYNRTEKAANESVNYIGAGKAISSINELTVADFYFFACSDDVIEDLSSAVANNISVENSIAWHSSGAKSSRILDKRFSMRASIHPNASISAENFCFEVLRGVFCGVEGDDQAVEFLSGIFRDLGVRVIEIDSEKKVLYHAGAVFASNFIPQLVEAALQCYEKAGINREVGIMILQPLVESTVKNVVELTPRLAQTGPASRGDFKTVQLHESALIEELPHFAEIYWKLSEQISNQQIYQKK
ncbi:MAG: Rossmann-like and DUF2520 domain-containing protein [Lentisphaeria bacterium]